MAPNALYPCLLLASLTPLLQQRPPSTVLLLLHHLPETSSSSEMLRRLRSHCLGIPSDEALQSGKESPRTLFNSWPRSMGPLHMLVSPTAWHKNICRLYDTFTGYKGFSYQSPYLILRATLRGRPDARGLVAICLGPINVWLITCASTRSQLFCLQVQSVPSEPDWEDGRQAHMLRNTKPSSHHVSPRRNN